MVETEMNGDKVHFCTDNQSVSLHPPGPDPSAVTPTAPKTSRLVQATLAFTVVTIIICLMALFVMVLQKPRPVPEARASSQEFPGDNTTGWSPVEADSPHHSGRVAELQAAIQTFKDHVENCSTCSIEIQMLTCRVDNVSSQIQMLRGHMKNACADTQVVEGILKDVSTLSSQTQRLRNSLEGASAEIQKQKGDLEKASALNDQTQAFLKSSLENTSREVRVLSGGLENANADIQALKVGLEMANSQAQLANSSLKDANAQILVLRGTLDSVNDLKSQSQALRHSLEGVNTEIQKLKGSLQNANALNSQTQVLLKGGLDNSSAEIQLLKGHLERAGNEIQLLKRGLETATAQIQTANGRLAQTDAQIQVLNTELEKANALNSNIQVLNDNLKNANGEIKTLKEGMKDAATLNSKTRTLENNLKKANAEIQGLKAESEKCKTLSTKVQETERSLETLKATFTSQEQLCKTQSQLLKLILQSWKIYNSNLYYFSNEKKSWHEAEQFCVSHGAHLASVASAEEQAYLTQFTERTYHWIGLTDSGNEGSWRWVDGTPFNFAQSTAFWYDNQPDNWRNKDGQFEDCVHMQQKWNDMNCNSRYHWVCKKHTSQDVA